MYVQFTSCVDGVKERYFISIQSTSWLFENSEFDSYDKNDMKKKLNDLVRLHKAIQEKLKQNHIQIKSKFLPWYLEKLSPPKHFIW